MKILICTNSIGANGGIERVTIVKANAFAEMDGIEVAICYTDRGTYPHHTIHPLSSAVKVIDTGVSFWDLNPLSIRNIFCTAPIKFLRLRKSIIRIICEYRPDVVVSTGSYEKYAIGCINLSKILDKPAIKIREYHFNSDYRKYITPSLLASVAAFFEDKILSRNFDMNYLLTKEDLIVNHEGQANFSYQYNPLPLNNRKPEKKRNVVLAVGRLVEQKNFSSLIRVWGSISYMTKDWQLWIAGEGEQRSQLADMAERMGVADSVRFLGFCKNMEEVYSLSKICALTSKYEGFGVCLIEAMAHGAVPISYRTPYGPSDIITDDVNGILVDYLDEHQFGERLLTLIRDNDKLDKMSQKSIERSMDFATESISKQWIDYYRNLIIKKASKQTNR